MPRKSCWKKPPKFGNELDLNYKEKLSYPGGQAGGGEGQPGVPGGQARLRPHQGAGAAAQPGEEGGQTGLSPHQAPAGEQKGSGRSSSLEGSISPDLTIQVTSVLNITKKKTVLQSRWNLNYFETWSRSRKKS